MPLLYASISAEAPRPCRRMTVCVCAAVGWITRGAGDVSFMVRISLLKPA